MNPDYHEAIQVAGKAYNGRTMEPYPPEQGGEFESLMKPLYPERLDDEALAVNKKTREQLAKAPDQKVVWNKFVAWVGKYKKNTGPRGAPIACGKNIRGFDLKFANKLCELHCPKGAKTVLFNTRRQIELEDIIFHWFWFSGELKNEKMDTLREYFGLPTEGAHDAMVDAAQTGDLIVRFLKLTRDLRRRKCKDGSLFLKFQPEACVA